jgi:hypothetical protein
MAPAVFETLAARKQRYLVARVDASGRTERVARTLEWDASPSRVRELVGEAAGHWDHGVLVTDPEPGTRIYVLPQVDGVVTRWDDLLRSHHERVLRELADAALAALGERPDSTDAVRELAAWIEAGAADESPLDTVPDLVPPARAPVSAAERSRLEQRARLLAKVLPIAAEIDPDNRLRIAHTICRGLLG